MTTSKLDSDGKTDFNGTKELTCGVVMPISPIDGASAEHWADVFSIITEAVAAIPEPQFVARLVSDANDAGFIQKRIIQNVYGSSIVVCDVSAKNPNVMFELGLRAAFDRPFVIIKDDKTDYSFDTGVIEHIAYPRDLRFTKIVEFKRRLAEKVVATYKASKADASYSFLSSFGQFTVASLRQTEASTERVILEMLSELQRDVSAMKQFQNNRSPDITRDSDALKPAERLRFLLDLIERYAERYSSIDDPVFIETIVRKAVARHTEYAFSREDVVSACELYKASRRPIDRKALHTSEPR